MRITQLEKLSVNHSIGRTHSWRTCNNLIKYDTLSTKGNTITLLECLRSSSLGKHLIN